MPQWVCWTDNPWYYSASALMRRLFRTLFSEGLIMVATSNRKPTDLYLNGIQRASFLPFIDDLQQRCHAHDACPNTAIS